MTQEPLFKDFLSGWLAAISADVEAAGGEKTVGGKLWPNLKPASAQGRMSNALNAKQRHELSADEVWRIKQMARAEVGRSRLHEFESGELRADIKWISDDEFIERKETLIETKLDDLSRELQELKEARRAAAARANGR
jgi:hypothetical protein